MAAQALEGRRLEVVIAAVEWWSSKRPKHWDESKHLMMPWVNCTSPGERHLASAAAEYVKRRKTTEAPDETPTSRGFKPRKERE